MKMKLIILKCIRLIFITVVFVWAVKTWDMLPDRVPLEFNPAMKPDKYGSKYIWSWNFLFLYAAYIPFCPDKKSENVEAEEKKAIIFSWIHSVVMCAIFVFTMYLVRKNLL